MLLLERAEGSKLSLGGNDPFYGSGAESADQLILQVDDAHIEAECFHVGAGEIGAEAGPLEPAPEVSLLCGVTETREPDVQPSRAKQIQEAPNGLRAPDRHDGNPLGVKVPTTAFSERFQCTLIADPLDEHNRPVRSLRLAHHLTLGVASRGPGDCLEREGRDRDKLPAPLFQLLAPDGVEAGHECPRRTDPESKRLPPIVETRVLEPNGHLGVVDVVEAGGLEQLGKVARAGSRELRFVLSAWIELPNSRPEQAQRTPPTGVVPDGSDDHPARTGDPGHLAQAPDGIRHEMDNKLRKGNVELGIGKGQLLRCGALDVDAGVALAGGDHE
jgi:hypothetical protein